jgi:hypothetical protein
MPSKNSTSAIGLAKLLTSNSVNIHLLSLLDRQDLLRLRLLSSTITSTLSTAKYLSTTFKIISAIPRNLRPELRQSERGLRSIGTHVRELVVKLCGHAFEESEVVLGRWRSLAPGAIFRGDDKKGWGSTLTNPLALSIVDQRAASLLSSSTQFPDPDAATNEYTTDSDWPSIFQCIPNLEILTIVTSSHPGGVCHTPISLALISLRVAFESSNSQMITTLRFVPIHIAYIPHFAWAGPSFGSASWLSLQTWSKITTLELQILLPDTAYTPLHNRQIWKTLQAYLRSFSKFLRVLKFHWLAPVPGPHPLKLDDELPKQHQSQNKILWPQLRELWVGRVRGEDIRSEIQMLAPKLCKYMVLPIDSAGAGRFLYFEQGKREVWDRIGKQADDRSEDEDDEYVLGQSLIVCGGKGKDFDVPSSSSMKSLFSLGGRKSGGIRGFGG